MKGLLPDAYSDDSLPRAMGRLLEQLEERHPLCTVSEEMLHPHFFSRAKRVLYSRAFVKRYGFSLDSVDKGLYCPGKLEYIFNGAKG